MINAIGAENEYANVLSQIGGKYVHVSSILNNPNTDPHTFEASPSVAEEVSGGPADRAERRGLRRLHEQDRGGVPERRPQGDRGAAPARPAGRHAQSPPLVLADDHARRRQGHGRPQLSALQPSHAAYFAANLATFDKSLEPWLSAISAFKAKYAGTTVAMTEPVADYLLQAMGMKILTPFPFQADIMNGVDPAPEDVTLEDGFFTKHQVKVFCYNQQVVDPLTTSIRTTAEHAGVPVVGVYETMPTPGYDYQIMDDWPR